MTHWFNAEALAELTSAGRYYNQQVTRRGDDFIA
jgi:hypothetical protein